MKKPNLHPMLFAGLPALALFLALLCSGGCEVKSAAKVDVSVTPARAELRRGESVDLTASGWEDFRWTLSNNNIGTLSATVGRTVVYTSTRSGSTVAEGETLEQVVTAIGITQGGTTNAVPGLAATSRIRHL